jgi:parvulin-like peptidyl-prolyl isomerase
VIERKILLQEARRLGIRVSQEELSQAIFEIKMDYPGEGFGEKLNLKGMTLEEWKVRLEEKLLAEKMIRSTLHHRWEIDEKEALQYYETHRSSFQLNQKVRARQIVVADGEDAIQILKRRKNHWDPKRLTVVIWAISAEGRSQPSSTVLLKWRWERSARSSKVLTGITSLN